MLHVVEKYTVYLHIISALKKYCLHPCLTTNIASQLEGLIKLS